MAAAHVATVRETYGPVLPEGALDGLTVDSRMPLWAAVTASPHVARDAVVGVRDGRIVGFALAGAPEGEVPADIGRQLFAIYEFASEHGTGLGAAMMQRVLGEADATLWVAEANPRAIRFYEKHGFVRDGAQGEHAYPGAPPLTTVRLTRRTSTLPG